MTYDADKLVAVYIKMRDTKDKLTREYDEKVNAIKAQIGVIENELLEICKSTGQDGGRTQHGSFTKSVKTRYWTSDWGSMYDFIRQHNAVELLEQRLHQGNMKTFLQDHPNDIPAGLNVDAKYSIIVRRATK